MRKLINNGIESENIYLKFIMKFNNDNLLKKLGNKYMKWWSLLRIRLVKVVYELLSINKCIRWIKYIKIY